MIPEKHKQCCECCLHCAKRVRKKCAYFNCDWDEGGPLPTCQKCLDRIEARHNTVAGVRSHICHVKKQLAQMRLWVVPRMVVKMFERRLYELERKLELLRQRS